MGMKIEFAEKLFKVNSNMKFSRTPLTCFENETDDRYWCCFQVVISFHAPSTCIRGNFSA